MDSFFFIFMWGLFFKIFKIIVEHERKVYKTLITKLIIDGILYFDNIINKVKKCQSFICFDPWSLKL